MNGAGDVAVEELARGDVSAVGCQKFLGARGGSAVLLGQL